MSIKKVFHSRIYKLFELLFFYFCVPIYFMFEELYGWWKILPLFIIAIYFLIILFADRTFDVRKLYVFNAKQFRRSLYRLVIIGLLILGFTWWFYPHLLFDYVVEEPVGYVVTFFLYPIASVIPQEIIYRVYFFHRYPHIIPNKLLLVFINAFIFGFTHMVYENWVAPIATFLASILFIYNYYKSGTLINVSIEHYLYGIILFTAGLGYFFM